jgi:hypothetical protein
MAEEIEAPVQEQQPTPYLDKVYSALKDNLSGFNKTPEQFKEAMKDSTYAAKAYGALKDNLSGFNKPQEEFYKEVGISKNGLRSGAPNTSNSLSNGLGLIPNSPQSIDYSPVLPQNRADIKAQQQAKLQAQTDHFKQLRAELDPEAQKGFDKALELGNTAHPDQLGAPTKEDIDHYNFMQTPVGKVLGTAGYIGSEATHGTLQVAKGIAHLANMANNPAAALTGMPEPTDEAFAKADKLADLGLTDNDKAGIENMSIPTVNGHRIGIGTGIQAAGQLANFAPMVAAGEEMGLPKTMLYLQGMGQIKEIADKIPNLNPLAKEALIQGGGLVNMALADFGGKYFNKGVSNAVKDKVIQGIAADALQEAAEKGLGEDGYKNLLTGKAQSFAEKFERAPSEVLKHYVDATKTFTKLNVENYAVHKGVDALQTANGDKPVFNENLGNLAENEMNTLTKQVPLFGSIGALGAASKLLPNSGYENEVTKSIIDNPTQANIDNVKYALEQHGNEKGWSQEELNATHDHVDKIAKAVQSLPPTIKDKTKAVGLVLDRNELQSELDQSIAERKKLDPAVAELPSPKEQYLTDKVEQANDKLRGLVTDQKPTYSKGLAVNNEDGKFFKTTGDTKEEIEPSRYELERTERDAKKKNEITEVSNINQTENGNNDEKIGGGNEEKESPESKGEKESNSGTTENGKENDQESGSNRKAEGNVVKAGADETVPVTNDPIRQKAIDAITHGIIGDGQRKPGDVSPRFDLDMTTDEQERAIRHIMQGKTDSKSASKMIDKVVGFEKKGEYPIIEGLGGTTDRSKFATPEEIQQHIDDAKSFKLAKEQDIEANNKGLHDLGITHQDVARHEEYLNSKEANHQSDADIEKRMSELDNYPSFSPERHEYNQLEKEMEKREKDSVFSVPLDKASDAIDALLKKNKEMPNGYGAFIEKRDARESKAVIERYTTDRNELSERDIKSDFKGALMGNPDTWYADGLKLRESANLAAERGINIGDLLKNVQDEFTKDGYDDKTSKQVIARMLSTIINKENGKQNAGEQGTTDNGRPTENTASDVQRPENDEKASVPQSTGGETTQSKPESRKGSLSEDKAKRLKELRKTFSGQLNDVTRIPTLLANKEFREYAGLVFEDTLGDFKAFSKELIDNVGEKIKEHLPNLYKELGGKLPDEEPKEPTGIRNADVETERGKVVPRDKMTKDQIEAEGKRLVDEGEVDPDELAQQVIKDKKPITAEEQAALLYHKTKLKKEQRSILKDNEENPDNVTENQIKYAKNADLIDANQQATEIAGNVTGRALGFRTETMNEDFSRNSVMRRAKMANQNEPLEPKDEKALEAHTKRIEELENKLSDREQQIRKLYEDGIVNKVNRNAHAEERAAKRDVTKASLRKEREGLLADLHLIAKKSRGTLGANKIPLDMVVPLTKLARNYVLDGVVTLSGVVDKLYTDLKDHIEDLNKEDIKDIVKEQFSNYLHEQNALRLKRSKTLLQTKLDKLKEQNTTGNVEKDVRRKIEVDNDYLKIRADINREQTLINKKIADIEQSNKSTQRKVVDLAVKYGRQAKLAAVKVLGKLAAAGLTTLTLKPITEGIGTFYSALLPKIADKATIEGKGNLKVLANAYAKAATLGMEDAYKELNIKKGGQSDLSALYGKFQVSKLPAEAADFFGHIHSAIKAPVKRFAWEYSYAKRMENQMRQGIDVQDPVIDAKNRLDAYKDAERAIFMGDNVISKAYEAALSPMEKGSSNFGKNIAATARILLPFVKVPTNIALSTGRHAFGLLMGGSKLAQIGTSSALRMAGAEKMAKIIHTGMGELTPEESDMVMRNLKVGSIGGAALLLGFYNPKNVGGFYQENEHRKKGDAEADALKIFGHSVPKFLTEHPIFQAMQVGATFRRVLDAHKHKDDNVNAATLATVSGLAEGIPLANEAKTFTDLFGSDTKKFNKFISNVVKGEVEPSVLQEMAQVTDTKNGAVMSLNSDNQNKRFPDKKHGLLKYMKQDLMIGIPGARKYVPKKH